MRSVDGLLRREKCECSGDYRFWSIFLHEMRRPGYFTKLTTRNQFGELPASLKWYPFIFSAPK